MKAKAAAFVVVAGLLLLAAPVPVPVEAAESDLNPFPEEVKATGTVLLKRKPHDGCLVAAPPTLEAEIVVVVNTVTGLVTGTIGKGTGSGRDLLVCEGDDSNERYIATINFTGVINGRIDQNTGIIAAPAEGGNVSMTVSGSGERGYYEDMPEWSIVQFGGGFVCGGSNDVVSTCSLGEFENVIFPARIEGSLTETGELDLEVDWLAPFCVSITTSNGVRETDYSPANCPRKGVITWSSVTISNQRPVIDSLSVSPAKPVTSDVITITVSASDPEDDELTYQWTVDGNPQQTINSPQTTYDNPTRGNHTFEVRVIDPAGGYDDAAITIWVEDPSGDGAPATTTETGGTTTTEAASGATSTTTTTTTVPGSTSEGSKEEPSNSRRAGGAAVLAAVIALTGEALRKGQVRGKVGELYRRGKRKVDRAKELEGKAERATAIAMDPAILLREEARKAEKRIKDSRRGKKAQEKFAKAQRKYRKVETIATNPLRAALDRVRESRRGRRLERRAVAIAGIAGDPLGTIDRRARKKLREEAKKHVSRIRARARRRVAESSKGRRYRRWVDSMSRRTNGILNARSTERLIRSIGNPRRFRREIRKNNPALVRHVIRRAGLSPVAIQALGGPKSIGRMLRRVSRNPGRELRRVGRFLGKPKGWIPEMGRGLRRVGRGFGRLVGIR